MYAMAQTVPFENLDTRKQLYRNIKRKSKEKILVNNLGGLCYELILQYYFLKDAGFGVHLVSGTVYNAANSIWAVDSLISQPFNTS